MGCSAIDWSTTFNGFVAFGTIAVAFLAIWGDWVRTKFVGPKLKLTEHNFRGTVTQLNFFNQKTQGIIDQKKTIYYHLKVENSRHWVPAKNCRVMLRQIHRRGPDGNFHLVKLIVPVQYMWAPSEWSPSLQTVTDKEVLDFGRIMQGVNRFEPTLYTIGGDFDGFVKTNEILRYGLQVIADNARPTQMQVFEVAWNGEWSDNLDEMEQNLKIREIPPSEQ